jgi:hypothetical protein
MGFILVQNVEINGNNDPNTLALSNAGLEISRAVGSKDEEFNKQVEVLKAKSIEIAEKMVTNSNVTEGVIGDKALSTQISTTAEDSKDKAKKEALDNGLSIVDLSGCIAKLREFYKIPESENLVIVKTDSDLSSSDSSLSKQVKISGIYRENKVKLDTSICNDDKIQVKIPMKSNKNDKVDVTRYREAQSQGIDIYNANDPAFRTRCVKNTGSDYDLTINNRISLFSNMSMSCSANCTYTGLDEYNYIQCDCSTLDGQYDSGIMQVFIQQVSGLNFDIATCSNLLFEGIGLNIGLYYSVAFTAFAVVLYVANLIKKKKLNIDKITYNDGLFYNDKNPDGYFLEKIYSENTVQSNSKREITFNDGPNSSRQLNNEKKVDFMILNDNVVGCSADKQVTTEVVMTNNFMNVDATKVVNSGDAANNKFVKVTYNDYLKLLSNNQIFQYDLRPFKQFVNEELIQHHCIVKLFSKHSMLDPFIISFGRLLLKINIIFVINALALSDSLIEERARNSNRVIKFIFNI